MKAGGKGLGLYISAELAQALGARLHLLDKVERSLFKSWSGAVFALELKKPEKGTRGKNG